MREINNIKKELVEAITEYIKCLDNTISICNNFSKESEDLLERIKSFKNCLIIFVLLFCSCGNDNKHNTRVVIENNEMFEVVKGIDNHEYINNQHYDNCEKCKSNVEWMIF